MRYPAVVKTVVSLTIKYPWDMYSQLLHAPFLRARICSYLERTVLLVLEPFVLEMKVPRCFRSHRVCNSRSLKAELPYPTWDKLQCNSGALCTCNFALLGFLALNCPVFPTPVLVSLGNTCTQILL